MEKDVLTTVKVRVVIHVSMDVMILVVDVEVNVRVVLRVVLDALMVVMDAHLVVMGVPIPVISTVAANA